MATPCRYDIVKRAFLGHSSIKMTEVYTKIVDKKKLV